MKLKRILRLLAVAGVSVLATVTTSTRCMAESLGVHAQALLSGNRSFGPTPKFRHGRLVTWSLEGGMITAYDSRGDVVTQTTLQLPDVVRLRIGDAAVAPDGTLAVRVSAYSNQGQYAALLIWLDQSGSIIRTVRTSPYQAFGISFDSDGVLWTIGRVHDAEYNATPLHEVLRQYDISGKLIRNRLPNNSMTSMVRYRHPAEECSFVELRDRMGMYCRQSHEWMEFSREAELLHRQRLQPLPPGVKVFGAAVAGETLFLSAQRSPETAQAAKASIRVWYRANRADGSLMIAEAPNDATGKSAGTIVGVHHNQLVTFADRKMFWVQVQ
jgi:hypothetical protein